MKKNSHSNKVYLEIRKKILSSQLISGVRLIESAWAKKLDVSRGAVREAFMRLAGESLVEFGEKGGCYVKQITEEDIKEIRELRELLELGALNLIFKQPTQKLIHELLIICDDFTDMVEKGYYGGACEADMKFHEKIIESTNNSRLIKIYKNSNIPLFHMKLGGAIMGRMEDYQDTDTEHRKIVNALELNDLKLAKKILLSHLDRGEKTALEWV